MSYKMDLIIFGASGGIGQYLVNYYKDRYNIYGTYYKHYEGLVHSDNIRYYKVDVQNQNEIITFINTIRDFLKFPVLIYTPGISINNLVHKYNEADWDKTIAINLTGAMVATKYLLPRMQELNIGRIIFLSSVLSRITVPGTLAYTATKSALNAMVRVITKENAKKNITANSLVLGYHDVGIISNVPKDYLIRDVIPNIPEGHLGNPINIVNAVDFIINSDFVSGAAIDINGGMF